jgi:hypothetical protein
VADCEVLAWVAVRQAELDALEERLVKQSAEVLVGGQAVLLIPHREAGMDDVALPPEYQRILAIGRDGADGRFTKLL